MNSKAIIIMGSDKDAEFCREIAKHLKTYGVEYELRVASAHKTPQKVLEIIKEHEKEETVFITVAGRSNALSAFVDAHTTKPVIACPPYGEKYAGSDIYSSLRVPSGIGMTVTIEPEGAAIATAKILSLNNSELAKRIENHQMAMKREIEKADNTIKKVK
jgi:5-(carboxyamino)imidazole ribonucleotide mutase